MSELQAIVDFAVELHKFINIDLFQRGYYQVRVALKISSKLTHKVEINFNYHQPNLSPPSSPSSSPSSSPKSLPNGSSSIVFPSCVVNGAAVSKTFQILYKNEEVMLNDVVLFKAHLIVDPNECIKQIRKTQFILDIELWYTDQTFGPDHHNSIECVSSKQLILHLDALRGLSYHLPVMFDYFHLSGVTVSIHGSLITLCQPYITRTSAKGDKKFGNNVHATPLESCSSGYDTLLFGGSSSVKNLAGDENAKITAIRLRRAHLIHWQLLSVLFTAINSVKRKLDEFNNMIGPWQVVKCNVVNNNVNLENLSPLAVACYKSCLKDCYSKSVSNFIALQNELKLDDRVKPEDFIARVESDMAYLCGLAIVQWQQYLGVVLHSERVVQHLAKVHHLHRIKRFSEAFFCIEKPRFQIQSICDNNSSVFNEISDSIRKSPYLTKLPPCDVECVALDGDANSLPIIYEERFDVDTASIKSSVSESSLNEVFENLSQTQESTLKRNMKDKLLNNLSKLHFGHGKYRDEYSPTSCQTSTSTLNRSDIYKGSTPSIKSSASHWQIKESVTLLKVRRFDSNKSNNQNDNDSKLLKGSSGSSSKVPSSFSFNDFEDSVCKRMTCSESLPDLSTKNSIVHQLKQQIPSLAIENNCQSVSGVNEAAVANQHSLKTNIQNKVVPSQSCDGKISKRKTKKMNSEDSGGAECDSKHRQQFTIDENDETDVDDDKPGDDDDDKTPTGNNSINSSAESTPKCKDDGKCTIMEMLKCDDCLLCGSDNCQCNSDDLDDVVPSIRRASAVGSDLISFVRAKEDFRQQISSKARGWLIYSDFPSLASRIPYFQCDPDFRLYSPDGLHLIICVHGLDGNSADLRLVKTYLELGLPATNFEFLMSQRNQGETFDGFEALTDRLVQEITSHIEVHHLKPAKISFIGHSLGNIIIRAALARPEMKPYLDKLHTFLSLSGPHLGTVYNNSGLVNMGLWFMQKWKKSGSLLQLAMKDGGDFRQTFLYRLSLEPGLEHFRNVLLCGSSQDHYVPVHSAHIELCTAAINDTSANGIAYREMVNNLLHPIMSKCSIKLIRFDVHHSLGSNANALIGRAAHIAVLDSELFIEKFMVVTGLKYFS